MSFKEDIKGKKVLVFGLGLQGGGIGDALWLHNNGAVVRVTDIKLAAQLLPALKELPAGIETSLGGHLQSDIDWADVIIKNPGVSDGHPLLTTAIHANKSVLTAIAVFVREARSKVIGITGTRGKSTTTELVFRVLDSVYPGSVIKGGNIPGTSGLALLDRIHDTKYAVLELSSFQLHNFHSLQVSPHVAVITNIYPDHLNRYPDMESYIGDKRAITAYQTQEDYTVYNLENAGAGTIADVSPGIKAGFREEDVPTDWDIRLMGGHNRENIAAVSAVSKILEININQVKIIAQDFHGLPFRLENRGVKMGITFINDTTSTTPTSTVKAIAAMTQPTVIILGGETKGLPIQDLIASLRNAELIKKIVILGSEQNTGLLRDLDTSLAGKIAGRVSTMSDAVELALRQAEPGWNLLLSPAFASFDLFHNEFDRGRQFNEIIDKL